VANWQAIEAEYRHGKYSVREIARRESVSEGAIRKRARRGGWPPRGTRPADPPENKTISMASTPGAQPPEPFSDQYAHAREAGTQRGILENNGPEPMPGEPEPTPDEARNGWIAATLAAYRRERERAAGSIIGANELVGGFVVTEFRRPRPRVPVLEGCGMGSKHYSPHGRWRGSR